MQAGYHTADHIAAGWGQMTRAIGLMSGTSLDGVDAAWLDTDGVSIAAFGPTVTLPYDDVLRRDLRAVLDLAPVLAPYDSRLPDVVERLTDYHIQAVDRLGCPADLAGFHGQTILHQPNRRRTWQIGDAARLASRLGVPVVHDFRSADVAAGGQGAPLAPVYHAALAASLPKPLAVLNIGGVANVTWLGRDGSLLAFDTGPGNGPLDDWVFQHTGRGFDANGALARGGRVDQDVLRRLMAHSYFAMPGPKSLDRLDFGRALEESGLSALSAADGAATLAGFTVASVVAAPFPERPERWLVCGGGRLNPVLMDGLRAALGVPVEPVETAGWNGDALEAQCFGFLAVRVMAGLPLSFPTTTGVPVPTVGGRVTQL
jgi:anhydro-N-acetylmuramic acid kinase